MSTPHRCPICLGKGELGPQKAKHDAVPIKVISKGNGNPKKIYGCHGCWGVGILWDGAVVNPQPFITSPVVQPYIGDPQPFIITWDSNKIDRFQIPRMGIDIELPVTNEDIDDQAINMINQVGVSNGAQQVPR